MKRAVLACLFSFALTSPAADSDPPLLLTAYDNEVEEAARLIAAGADPNKTNRYGVAPLSLACTNGNAELVKILLEDDQLTYQYLTDASSGLFTNVFLLEPRQFGFRIAKRW